MVRLRQVALVAADLDAVTARLEAELGLGDPYRDPNVAIFGLRNAVYAIGDTFLEVVSPVQEDTAAGRHLARRGGDAGYMAIFQVADLAAARRRVTAAGVRVAWEIALDDIATMHLHPADVPGAIVALDEADPPESWRWAGTAWRPGATGGITGITVRVPDPAAAERRWVEVIGANPGIVFERGDEGIAEVVTDGGLEAVIAGVRFR